MESISQLSQVAGCQCVSDYKHTCQENGPYPFLIVKVYLFQLGQLKGSQATRRVQGYGQLKKMGHGRSGVKMGLGGTQQRCHAHAAM